MDDNMQCELCDAVHPTDDMIGHGDAMLCAKCSAEASAAFHACAHVWEPDTDECGEPAQACRKCGGFIPNDAFEHIMGVPLPATASQH